jgi:tRNA (guanine26-N2/guanine27-N2)-dimethyltransferase
MFGFGRTGSLITPTVRSFRRLQRKSKMADSNTVTEEINAAPSGQEIVEGTVKMMYDTKEKVFYNKVQVFNRDISIQVIKLFAEIFTAEKRAKYDKKYARYEENSSSTTSRPPQLPKTGITILDALAASGLRSLRYVKEIPLVDHVTINDISEEANKLCLQNCLTNQIDMEKVEIHLQDATALMYQHRDSSLQYDVIDLDPYGSAANFLDAAVQSVADGGLLCVTCTDMTVLSGNYPETCFGKYQSMPVRGRYVHEMALRILLHSIDQTANKYKRYIVPWISLSVDFYVRVFVRVFESQQEVKNSCLKRCMLHQSLKTPFYFIQPVAQCNGKGNFNAPRFSFPYEREEEKVYGGFRMGGPFWSDPLHSQEIVDELLKRSHQYDSFATEEEKKLYPVATIKRILGILTTISEEIKDVPFFYTLPELASAVQSSVPTYQQFKAALNNLGYSVSQFHHEPGAVKTDAPHDVVRIF